MGNHRNSKKRKPSVIWLRYSQVQFEYLRALENQRRIECNAYGTTLDRYQGPLVIPTRVDFSYSRRSFKPYNDQQNTIGDYLWWRNKVISYIFPHFRWVKNITPPATSNDNQQMWKLSLPRNRCNPLWIKPQIWFYFHNCFLRDINLNSQEGHWHSIIEDRTR